MADFEEGQTGATPSLNHPITAATVVTLNVWHHAAATYDGSTWNLYLDGVLDGTLAVGATHPANAATTVLTSVGSALNTTGVADGFFAGVVDEVRIWSVARTLSQINATRNIEVTTPQTNLMGVWNLNEGSGTSLADNSGNGITGAAVGSPTWVAGFPLANQAPVAVADSYSTPLNTAKVVAAPGVLANDSDPDGNPITAALVTNVTHGTLSLAANGGFTYTPTTGYTGADSFTYRANDGSLNSNTVTVSLTVGGAATNQALQLNGTSQYATLGSTTQLRSATFTVELWFKRTGAGIGTNTGTGGIPDAIPLITKGRAESETAAADINYFLGIDASSGQLVADFEEGQTGATPSLNHPITAATVVTLNVWHHAAATYDGSTWNLYLDGVLDGTLAVGATHPANAATTVLTSVGSALNTTGVADGFFAGVVDEVRIWSVARTLSQINATRNVEVTTPQTNLMGVWNLNEGSGTSLADNSGNGITGAAVGSPTWVAGFPLANQAPVAVADSYSTPPQHGQGRGGAGRPRQRQRPRRQSDHGGARDERDPRHAEPGRQRRLHLYPDDRLHRRRQLHLPGQRRLPQLEHRDRQPDGDDRGDGRRLRRRRHHRHGRLPAVQLDLVHPQRDQRQLRDDQRHPGARRLRRQRHHRHRRLPPMNGDWYVLNGTSVQWGASGDIPVPGDYDGNGTTDMAVFRPSNGTWYIRNGTSASFGTTNDIPVPGDYDGNGTTDIAVFRPRTGSGTSSTGRAPSGARNGDIPAPGDYDGNGTTDMALFRPSTSTWWVRNGTSAGWGTTADIPQPGDYDGGGTTDMTIFRPSSSTWFVRNGTSASWGTTGDIGLSLPYAVRRVFFP